MTWEKDPAKHRKMAKELAHSFSMKSMNTLEPTMHKYVDAFVQKVKTLGDQDDGIELKNACPPPPAKARYPTSLSGVNLYTSSRPTGLHWWTATEHLYDGVPYEPLGFVRVSAELNLLSHFDVESWCWVRSQPLGWIGRRWTRNRGPPISKRRQFPLYIKAAPASVKSFYTCWPV